MESRKLLPNASYFAFTATPKNKTLEIFGEPVTRRRAARWAARATASAAARTGFTFAGNAGLPLGPGRVPEPQPGRTGGTQPTNRAAQD